MIYNPTEFKKRTTYYAFGPAREYQIDDNSRVRSPHVTKGKYIQFYMNAAWPSGETPRDYQIRVKETTVVQPCSVDILLKEFTDKDGIRLDFPIVVPPSDEIVGHSHIGYINPDFGGTVQDDYYTPGSIVCVETRSSVARKGLACTGFYTGEDPTVFFEDECRNLSFVLRNYSPNSMVISKPFSPVQISVTVDGDGVFDSRNPFRLFRNGQDVTEENLVKIGNFVAYKVHLSEEAAYPMRVDEPVDVTGNDTEKIVERIRVTELQRYNPDFCLTLTDEEVHTNGCPSYMYPFHYLDAVENVKFLEDTSLLSRFFKELFSDSKYLPVTANAGLINPGTHGKVVCENITKGRDIKKYFNPHEPFALIIPVPFYGGGIDNDTYKGLHHNQQRITF
ncbi:MAG: hypothetical protein HYW24_03235 [Candidatus Aenigmarchaeota archaeon]|nr:hypothetical protein [Candidatus Aenigmarchaeota archaeon]